MALALNDRVQQTGTANTTVSFTLTGSVTGFQSFAVVGNGNTTYYAATDASGNWEVGIGTYATSGPTLTRTTILASSNSGSAVTFSGTVNVFVTYPSEKSVNLDGSNNVSALGTIGSGIWQGTTVGVGYGGTGVTASSGANSVMLRDANQNVSINRLNQSSTSITAGGGTTTLTAASTFSQILSGTGGQTFKLPDATTLTNTTTFEFNNNATGTLTIIDNASGAVGTITSGGAAAIALLSNGTVAGTWDVHAYIPESVTWGTNALNLGTTVITNGTWNGGTITSGYGGTGLTTFSAANNALYSTSSSALAAGTLPSAAGGTSFATYATGDIIYASATNTLSKLTAGTNGYVLTLASGVPSWAAPAGGSALYVRTSFTATAGQTSFTASYTVGYVQVYQNGVLLNGTDYTATTGTNIVLAVGAATGDIIETLAFTTGAIATVTNLYGGSAGVIPYQSATDITSFTAVGTSGQVLTSAGTGTPTWTTPTTGTVTSVTFTGGLITVATNTTTPAFTVAGTSGGIPYFSSGTTWASSAALAANALVIGGGAGITPATLASTGTTTTVLHGNASGAPTFGAVSLTADVSGTLPIANGGTNLTTYTTGDILYSSAANTLSKLSIGTTGQKLSIISGIPDWESSSSASVFTTGSAQTYTVPAGVTRVKVTVQGPGGTGGGTGTTNRATGGSAGGTAIKWLTVTPGDTMTYTVGTATGTNSTVVYSAVTYTGASGSAGTTTAYAASQTAGPAGGAATNGDINITGQSGGTSYGTGTTLATNFSGQGGNSQFGQGGQMSAITAVAGKAAVGHGAGGGGSIGNATGGAASGGIIIFEPY
jgi:hypothetical protein